MSMTRKIFSAIGLITAIPLLVTCYLYTGVSAIIARERGIIIYITAFIIILGIIVLMNLTRTLIKLYNSLTNIANGDFNHKVDVDKTSGTQGTAISINQVSQRLRESADELEKRAILIERFTQQLRKRNEVQSRYLSDVVHDLRTPLINIDKNSALLLGKKVGVINTNQKNFLKIISDNSRRLMRLVNDLLDISKIESGQLSIKHEPLDIEEVITEAVNSVDRWRESKDLWLETKISPDLPEVYADRDRMIQVIINLLSNAIKFTPAEGHILVEAKRFKTDLDLELSGDKEKFIEVSVKDTGTGVPQAQKERIFERYKTTGDKSFKSLPSTGLGLPIAKEIIKMHGGRIWVESQPGEGSKFTFIIPQSGLQKKPEEPVPKLKHTGKKVLVIDDEDAVRDLLDGVLNKRGYFVATAKNGLEGLRKAIEDYYDLVITDVRMPNVDGADCIRILKKINPDASFMVITGFPVEKSLEDILRMNAYPCIKKPFDLPDLLKTVEESCSLSNKIKNFSLCLL